MTTTKNENPVNIKPRSHPSTCIATVALLATAHSQTALAEPCDGAPNGFLFSDDKCTLPVEKRFGDNETGTTYEVYSCGSPKVTTVKFSEVKRKSRIATDLKAVLDSIRKDDLRSFDGPQCVLWTTELANKRATLTVEAHGPGDDGKDKQLQVATVLTGPKEHWYLGLDLPITDQKTLKYNPESDRLESRDKDAQLYLSMNYLLGDILVDVDEDPDRSLKPKWTDNLAVKFFVTASSRPFDSAGISF